MQIKPFIAYTMLTGLSAGLIYLFSAMWVSGSVQATEPNPWIRGAELGSCIIIFGFAGHSMVKWLVEAKRE